MSFTTTDSGVDNEALAEINMVPLIDVMLVLLVIFIVTAPLLTHAVKVDLPQASSTPNLAQPDNIQLAIAAGGQTFWNGQAIQAAALGERMRLAAAQNPQPEIHLRADRATPYAAVAQVMALAARNGLKRLGFVTEPTH